MKRNSITIITIVAVLLLAGGTFYYFNQNKQEANSNDQQVNVEPETQRGVREAVWEQLSLEQKAAIDGTWSDGEISTVVLREGMMAGTENQSYIGKEVYLINFPTKSEGIPNNIAVYADIETHEYIGDGFVD